jgi:hypothetical protein
MGRSTTAAKRSASSKSNLGAFVFERSNALIIDLVDAEVDGWWLGVKENVSHQSSICSSGTE